MLSKIQSALFTNLSEMFSSYGINSEFKFSRNLDVLNEFRKSIRLRVENNSAYESIINETFKPEGSHISNMGLFNRQPIRKSDVIGNNLDLEVFSRKYNDSTGVELRGAIFGEVTFTVKMIFDNVAMMELCELIYLYKLSKKTRKITVDYNFGDDIELLEDVEYNALFSEIEYLGEVNSSNLSEIDFTIVLTGLFFMPFYKDVPLLDRIVINFHVTNNLTNLTPDSLNEPSRVDQITYVMDHNP